MKKSVLCFAIVGVLSLGACATKQYPIATPVSSAELTTMTCRELELELIRGEQVQIQIEKTGELNWRSVAGFLGDYGIGNTLAKNEASKALFVRMSALRNARNAKGCNSSN